MKVLSLLASPRKKGYTSKLLNSYLNGLKNQTKAIEIKESFIEDLNVNGCKACNACQNGKIELCIRQDDMTNLYQEILEADVIIFATPIYFFSVTAQLKSVIDRLYAILGQVQGKEIVLLTTYGAETEEAAGVNNVINMFNSACLIAGMNFKDQLHLSTMHLSDTNLSDAMMLKAFELGNSL